MSGPSRHHAAGSPCQVCSVRNLAVCAALDPVELGRLAAITTEIRLGPQQMVFCELDPAEHLYNVTGGAVRIYKLLADGRRQIIGFLFPGDFLGLASDDRYTYSAETITAARLCRFPRDRFERLLLEFPRLERRLFQTASNELAAAQDQMLLLGRKSAAERIASFLLSLAERARRRGELAENIPLPMSRSDIGDYLGLTIETVSRTLTKLKNQGLIALPDTHTAEVRDPEGLRALAAVEEELSLSSVASF